MLDPAVFALTYCVKRLDQWQRDVLAEARRPGKVAVVGANGIGKTVLIAILVLYFMAVYRNCRVIVTSGVGHQLEMFKEHLLSLLKNFQGWEPRHGSNELWAPRIFGFQNKCKWFTTERGGFAKGQHSVVEARDYDEDEFKEFVKDSGVIILIRDESGEIPKDIKESGDTYGAQFIFNFGNSTTAQGWWYDCFTQFAALYKTFTITAWMSSYWSKQRIDEFIAEHGEDSDTTNIALHAKFVSTGLRGVLSLSELNDCFEQRNVIVWRHDGIRVGGLDVSAATGEGDDCVAWYRLGNKYYEPKKFIGFKNYVDLCGEILNWALDLKLDYLYADKGGAGAPVIDVLERMVNRQKGALKLIRVDFGGKPNNEERYHDKATEMYFSAAQKIREKRVILPEGVGLQKLRAQFCTRPYEIMDDGTFKLVSKRRLAGKPWFLKSPDWSDSYVETDMRPAKEIHAAKTHDLDWHLRNQENESQEADKFNRAPSGASYGGI